MKLQYIDHESNTTDFYEPNMLAYIDYMMNAIPGQEYLKAVYHPVSIHVNPTITTDKVLFDTGALHTNYISKEFVDRHLSSLRKHMFRKSSTTTLADKKTKVPMEYVIFLPVSIETKSSGTISATLPFWVFDMEGNDIIIGLPAILKYFREHLVDMLVDASDFIEDMNVLAHIPDNEPIYPWSYPIEPAPEEEYDDIPSSFPTFIAHMNTTPDQAISYFTIQLFLESTSHNSYIMFLHHVTYIKQPTN